MNRAISSSLFLLIFTICTIDPAMAQLSSGWRAHDLSRPLPEVVTPGESNLPAKAPSDAIVLFDGQDFSKWVGGDGQPCRWKIVDGAMEPVVGSGNIQTVDSFGDCQLHVEWASPTEVKGDSQGRGNSGVFLMGRYEIQVLDSFNNKTYADGSAGSVYGQFPPLVNVCRGPGEWQSYDIIFRQARFADDGKLVSPATVTVLHNGVLIQDHESLMGPTNWIAHDPYEPGPTAAPIGLQDHGNPVRFRNIWIRKLGSGRPQPETAYRSTTSDVKLTTEQMDQIAGDYQGFSVRRDGEKLYLNHLGRNLEMLPVTETEFEFKVSAGSLKVEMDEQGQAKSISGVVDAAGKFSGQKK